MLKPAVLFASVLAWVSACVGCGTKPPAVPSARELASELESETVALVRLDEDPDSDEKLHIYCAGVFISPNVILTAGHCVEKLGLDPMAQALAILGLGPEPAPLGQEALFSMAGHLTKDGGDYWRGKVVGYDRPNDLAAIFVVAPPPHGYARLSTSTIEDGDAVECVGHPLGFSWFYSAGYVSRVFMHLHFLPRPMANEVPTLVLSLPFEPGNSGSGAFDRSGNLIGIGSYASESFPGTGFFIHRDVVRRFLGIVGLA